MGSVSLNGCYKCVKYALFAFCLVAWIIGLVSFIWGIVARTTGHFGPLESHLPTINAGANLLITVGFFIMLVGFLGCCGAIRESQFLLMAFFFSVFLCFTLLMSAGLWAVAWKSKLAHHLYTSLGKLIVNYEKDGNADDIKLLNFIQTKFSCCGITGVADYRFKSPPPSCVEAVRDSAKQQGCHMKIEQAGRDNLSTMTGIGIGFASIMVCGMIFSLMLCCALREIN